MSTSSKPTDDNQPMLSVQAPERSTEPDQSYLNSKEWKEGLREAVEDLKEGRYKEFDDVEDLIADLKS